MKPSEVSPSSSAVIKKLIDKYLDNDAFAAVEGGIDVAQAVNNLQLDLICFTGSTMVGKIVAQCAAKNMIPCIMELGGKCPCVINNGVNMEAAASKIAFGRFCNSGQTCVAPDYVLCQENLIKPFIETLTTKIKQMYGEKSDGSPY